MLTQLSGFEIPCKPPVRLEHGFWIHANDLCKLFTPLLQRRYTLALSLSPRAEIPDTGRNQSEPNQSYPPALVHCLAQTHLFWPTCRQPFKFEVCQPISANEDDIELQGDRRASVGSAMKFVRIYIAKNGPKIHHFKPSKRVYEGFRATKARDRHVMLDLLLRSGQSSIEMICSDLSSKTHPRSNNSSHPKVCTRDCRPSRPGTNMPMLDLPPCNE